MDPGRLRCALAGIPAEAWSLPSTYADTGVHHGYRRVVLVSAQHPQPYADLFNFVWEEFSPVRDAWLSWIDPGGFVVPHCDAGPWWERWQLPIEVSGGWHCSGGSFTAVSGTAFPVQHWEMHAVTNRGEHPRVHVVIDRGVPVGKKPKPFQLYSPTGMNDLIERTTHQ